MQLYNVYNIVTMTVLQTVYLHHKSTQTQSYRDIFPNTSYHVISILFILCFWGVRGRSDFQNNWLVKNWKSKKRMFSRQLNVFEFIYHRFVYDLMSLMYIGSWIYVLCLWIHVFEQSANISDSPVPEFKSRDQNQMKPIEQYQLDNNCKANHILW